MHESIIEAVSEIDEDILFADGFDAALIGAVTVGGNTLALYDREKCIQVLVSRDGMTYEDAAEFFEFNVAGAYVGEKTPAFTVLLNH